MNLEELEEVLTEVFPGGYKIDYDEQGQLIINTGFKLNSEDELVDLDDEEDDFESELDDLNFNE